MKFKIFVFRFVNNLLILFLFTTIACVPPPVEEDEIGTSNTHESDQGKDTEENETENTDESDSDSVDDTLADAGDTATDDTETDDSGPGDDSESEIPEDTSTLSDEDAGTDTTDPIDSGSGDDTDSDSFPDTDTETEGVDDSEGDAGVERPFAPGDDCSDPFMLPIHLPADLPILELHGTTCGAKHNSGDYTCLGTRDGGEEIFFKLEVEESVTVSFSLATPEGDPGIAIDTECPVDNSCVAFALVGKNLAIPCTTLSKGLYYLQIDSSAWSQTPKCVPEFTLDITSCICAPGETRCKDENHLETCNAIGSAWELSLCEFGSCAEDHEGEYRCEYPGDTCADVYHIDSSFRIYGDDFAESYAKDYDFGQLEGCSSGNGVEAIFSVDLLQGEKLKLAQTGSMDATFRILDSCESPVPKCLFSKKYVSDAEFTAPADNTYFIVLEQAYSSSSSKDFDFEVEILRHESACDDGEDNDENGLIDCEDTNCYDACGITTVLSETFDFWPPADWQISVHAENTCSWQHGLGDNQTGGAGGFALADSDACGSGKFMDTVLISPALPLGQFSSANLYFQGTFVDNFGSSDLLAVEISSEGDDWNRVLEWAESAVEGQSVDLDITDYIGENTVIGFRYQGINDWSASIDNILVIAQ